MTWNLLSTSIGGKEVSLFLDAGVVFLCWAQLHSFVPATSRLGRLIPRALLWAALPAALLGAAGPPTWAAVWTFAAASLVALSTMLISSADGTWLITLAGVTAIGMGIAALAIGVQELVEGTNGAEAVGFLYQGAGVALGGVVVLRVEGFLAKPLRDRESTVFCTAVLIVGAAMAGVGIGEMVHEEYAFGMAAVGLGIAVAGLAVTGLLRLWGEPLRQAWARWTDPSPGE